MNLVIDQGNTICKLALFGDEDELLKLLTCPELNVDFLQGVLNNQEIQACILSSVKELKPEIINYLQSNMTHFIRLDFKTPLPIKNAYRTPQTLGFDRIAAAVGAWSIQQGKPLLVVDMGTAITYDFVGENGTFIGGNIAPGMLMRLKALNKFTNKLPLLEPVSDFPEIGTDTQSAILAGVMQGMVYEVEGHFRNLSLKYPNLFTFLTGGDLIYFEEKLKNGIFVCKNLVLIGLNRILQYNVHS